MSRPTLLLLTGHMCTSALWDGVRADLLAAGWALAEPDLSADHIDRMAHEALAAAEGRIVAIGFSMGGIVALACQRLQPGRIAGLVLLDTNPGADFPDRAEVRLRQQLDVRAGRLADVVRDELKPAYLAEANTANQPLKAMLTDMALRAGAERFAAQSEALRTRPDQWPVLTSITAPTLVACGAEDRLCPPAQHQTIAAQISTAELAIVPDAGHMLPLEQPAALRSLVLPFLETIR